MAKKKRASKRKSGGVKVNKTRLVKESLATDPDASPSELSQQFAQQGYDIPALYISNIKSRLKKEGGAAGSADGGKFTKTGAIKDYFRSNPKAMPRVAAAELTEKHGVEFTTNTVSTIKHKMKKNGELRRPRKAAPAGKAAVGGKASPGFNEMLAAKDLVQRLGGVEQARKALDAYTKLVK
jgi:hypothetical protein